MDRYCPNVSCNLSTTQESFETGLVTFKTEGVEGLNAMKEELLAAGHNQSRTIQQRYTDVMRK